MKRATFSLVVVAIAGFALIAISSGALSAAENPVYARIVVSPKCTVYVQFDGSEMRLATTAPGLKSAKAIKARRSSDQHASFAEVALPVAAQDMPTGLTKMTGQFDVMHFAGRRAAGQPESYVDLHRRRIPGGRRVAGGGKAGDDSGREQTAPEPDRQSRGAEGRPGTDLEGGRARGRGDPQERQEHAGPSPGT
jgi:hypothetical protein